MIYPAEADIALLVKNLVQGLQSYAKTNEVNMFFQSNTRQLMVEHYPSDLVQALSQLVCQIINLVPHQSEIYVRLRACTDYQEVWLEVENTGINLMPINEINSQCIYSFHGQPLSNGTLYRLSLPLHRTASPSHTFEEKNTGANELPKFYAEVRKRLRSHFTQAEKLVAALSHSQPREAAFLQKINALITANQDDERFDSTAMCKAMAMSRTQLFRRLKPLIQQAPAQYIKMMRLQKAKGLLETTDLAIGEVAFKTGFRSQSHFTKVFLQQYGVLPSAFHRTSNDATNE